MYSFYYPTSMILTTIIQPEDVIYVIIWYVKHNTPSVKDNDITKPDENTKC
jgi:hypothetical protein